MTTDLMDRVRSFDPAAGGPLSAREESAREALLERLEQRPTAPSRPFRRRRITLVAAALVTVAAVGVVVVAVHPWHVAGSAPTAVGIQLDRSDVAGWTSVPGVLPAESAVETQCARILSHEPFAIGGPDVRISDERGAVQSIILTVSGYTGWCVLGSGGQASFVLLADPQHAASSPGSGQVEFGSSGAYLPSEPDAAYGFAEGRVGSDVAGLVLHQAGSDTVATVGNGWWMAWWPHPDDSGVTTGTVTITLNDGTSSTVPIDSIRTE